MKKYYDFMERLERAALGENPGKRRLLFMLAALFLAAAASAYGLFFLYPGIETMAAAL